MNIIKIKRKRKSPFQILVLRVLKENLKYKIINFINR